jgi:hypothetical protein
VTLKPVKREGSRSKGGTIGYSKKVLKSSNDLPAIEKSLKKILDSWIPASAGMTN